MNGGVKEMDKFRKLWDKGNMKFTPNADKLSNKTSVFSFVCLFYTGLAAQVKNPDGKALICLAIRQVFENTCSINPQFAQTMLENPIIKSAQKNLENSINQMEQLMQRKQQ